MHFYTKLEFYFKWYWFLVLLLCATPSIHLDLPSPWKVKKKKKKSCRMNGLVETVCEMLSGSVSSCRQSLPCSLNVVTFSPLRALLREPRVTDAVDGANAAKRAHNKCMKNVFH